MSPPDLREVSGAERFGSPMRVLVAIGSNLGERRAVMATALERLEQAVREGPGTGLEAVSSLYETEPVGSPASQGLFLNAVASLRSAAAPRELLALLQDLERRAGRVRLERWGPRTLDLDLLWIDEGPGRPASAVAVAEAPVLVVPHPLMWQRGFVLAPLSDVAPDLVGAVHRSFPGVVLSEGQDWWRRRRGGRDGAGEVGGSR